MKRIFLIFGILLSINVFAQETPLGSSELPELNIRKQKAEIFTIVEKAAEFPKGIDSFKHLIIKNFKERKVTGQGVETCELIFVVERDGSMTDIQAKGSNESFNEEAIRALSKIRYKWAPAEINGYKVRSRYKVPLTLRFD
ncbi:energy transducer TonB [Chryseobacterium daecheongense]|uniref:energy transducer TonB n=1 Tax=Chryseobacterium daecheongense TaxID=192389 RepID=UPI001FD6C57B|nr:energy transducer TonB [Chryseobacterium daecheongense]UOU99278.1 energy transducer TonB [Chryseobacterium daecheongense]